VEYQKLRDMHSGETSAVVRVRVEAAREQQRKRFVGTGIASNADRHPAQIRKYCVLDDACHALMKTAMRQRQLTAQAYHRVLKLTQAVTWQGIAHIIACDKQLIHENCCLTKSTRIPKLKTCHIL
jgi:magnesium chelatase family protein